VEIWTGFTPLRGKEFLTLPPVRWSWKVTTQSNNFEWQADDCGLGIRYEYDTDALPTAFINMVKSLILRCLERIFYTPMRKTLPNRCASALNNP
jgi:hypothetical protein